MHAACLSARSLKYGHPESKNICMICLVLQITYHAFLKNLKSDLFTPDLPAFTTKSTISLLFPAILRIWQAIFPVSTCSKSAYCA